MTQSEAQQRLNVFVKNSIELAWLLGGFYESGAYKQWGYSSFAKWIKQGKTGISSGYAYSLARIGRYFSKNKEEITQAVIEQNIPVRHLIDLTSKIDQGLPKEIAIQHILTQSQIPPEFLKLSKETDPENPKPLQLFVPQGDFDAVELGLVLYCLRNNCKNQHEAFRMMCLDESQNWEIPSQFKKWVPVIFAGKYRCKFCQEIPDNPTFHHILPRSLFDGWGPIVILCLRCHTIVQPQWKFHAFNWGFNLTQLATDYKKGLEEGLIKDVDPEQYYYQPELIS